MWIYEAKLNKCSVRSVIVTMFAGMLNVGTTIYVLVFGYAFTAFGLFIVRPSYVHNL